MMSAEVSADGGLALVIESDGPRTAFRYSTGTWCLSENEPLFEALSPEAMAKLFCRRRALSDLVLELQIDDVVFVSCPTTAERWQGEQEYSDEDYCFGWSHDTFQATEAEESNEHSADDTIQQQKVHKDSVTFSVVLAASRATLKGVGGIDRLRTAARDLCAALGHEEARSGYVSLQSELLATAASRQAALEKCSLARELAAVCNAIVGREKASIILNDWIEIGIEPVPASDEIISLHNATHETDLFYPGSTNKYEFCLPEKMNFFSDSRKSEEEEEDDIEDEVSLLDSHSGGHRSVNHRERQEDQFSPPSLSLNSLTRHNCIRETLAFAPYETLLLFYDEDKNPKASIWAGATSQLSKLASAADPCRSFRDLADDVGLPLERIYDLARHLVRWRRASVAAVVSDQALYAVRPNSFDLETISPFDLNTDMIDALRAFGPVSSYERARNELANYYMNASQANTAIEAKRRATDAILRAIRRGHLYRLHTYAFLHHTVPSIDTYQADIFLPSSSSPRFRTEENTSFLHHQSLEDKTASPPPHSNQQRPDFSLLPLSNESDLYDQSHHHDTSNDYLLDHVSKVNQDHTESNMSPLHTADIHLSLSSAFEKLKPYFDGRHSVIEMSWRVGLRVEQIFDVLKEFEHLVITVQR